MGFFVWKTLFCFYGIYKRLLKLYKMLEFVEKIMAIFFGKES